MPISRDLRTTIGRIDAAIAASDSYHRVDLDRLRRELDLIATDAAAQEEAISGAEMRFVDLADGIERSGVGLQRLSRLARQGAAT